MKIVRFNTKGNCQFIYFDWHDFKIKTSCWAKDLAALFGSTRNKKHLIIGIWK